MPLKNDRYTYRVTWSEDDKRICWIVRRIIGCSKQDFAGVFFCSVDTGRDA